MKNRDVFEKDEFNKYLHTKWLGREVVYEKEMDSTNIQVKKLGDKGVEEGILVVTDLQTAGKGRRGRSWMSPEGNCYFSFLLRPDIETSKTSIITLIAALSVAKAVRRTTNLETWIKWPNDVVVGGKKLCGILTEGSILSGNMNYMIVGIGINTNQKEFAEDIQNMATSIYLETGKELERSRLIAELLNAFEEYYEIFLKTQDMSLLENEYNSMLINKGKEVKVIEKDSERILTAMGIDKDGGLIVKDKSGEISSIIAGEVSVRGLYGYV